MTANRILVVIAALVAVASAASIPISTDPLVAQYYSIPQSDKENFLAYFLALGVVGGSDKTRVYSLKEQEVPIPYGLGISDEDILKFESMDIPASSMKKLVDWTKDKFDLGDDQLIEMAKQEQACSPDGVCVSIPDVNHLCCPW